MLRLLEPEYYQSENRGTKLFRLIVHAERVIQRIRQYELLSGTIPWTLAPYVEDVLLIVAGLTNLGPPVINIDKFM
ncbi:Beta-glucosidase BoGH3B [Frankliniella fusca]|uniref:Beta-glucosidase BoGH3B n=1 Tax=Frankliniella fusca TaxID=407009 RepID=A0AAE1HXF1_9NEOP|nr:Beta-glucosidase BoGH3B [Frankliniella fusca]